MTKVWTMDDSVLDARDQYKESGYLIFDPEIDVSILDQAIQDMNAVFGNAMHGRKQDLWKTSEACRAIALNENVDVVLKGLYASKPLPFQTLSFKVGTEQEIHSDTIHFNSHPAGLMCGVWLALEDVDENNGPLVFYEGSHKLPEVNMQTIGVAAKESSYHHYEDYIARLVVQQGLTRNKRLGIMKKGQCLIWASNLLHGGALRWDKTRTRLSQVTHYFFEGAEYFWTPLLSVVPDQIHKRDISKLLIK
jgi:hypothetical protein